MSRPGLSSGDNFKLFGAFQGLSGVHALQESLDVYNNHRTPDGKRCSPLLTLDCNPVNRQEEVWDEHGRVDTMELYVQQQILTAAADREKHNTMRSAHREYMVVMGLQPGNSWEEFVNESRFGDYSLGIEPEVLINNREARNIVAAIEDQPESRTKDIKKFGEFSIYNHHNELIGSAKRQDRKSRRRVSLDGERAKRGYRHKFA